MSKRLLLLLVLVGGLAGCSGMAPFLNTAAPGYAEIDGAQVQLLFSNPNFADHQIEDVPTEVFGRRSGQPVVNGGIGAMATWQF